MRSIYNGVANYLYVGNVASTAADGAAIDSIASGSVAFCTEDNKVEKAANTTDKLRVAQKLADGSMIYSPYFDMSQLKSKSGTSYATGNEQTTYVGYNGTSGALDATADTYFSIDTEWLNTMGVCNNTPFRFPISYKTVAASQEELAIGLMTNGVATMSRQPFEFIKIEAVSDGALTELAADTTVVNGSTYVASAGHGLSAGDNISLQGATYEVATAATDSLTLTLPYQGTSETIAVATTADLAASVGAITNWGIRMVGQDNPTFDPINDTYEKTRFSVFLDTFTTAKETTTEAVEDTCETKSIAQQEVFSQFLDKDVAISAYPRTTYRGEVDLDETYDMCAINVAEQSFVNSGTGQAMNHKFHILIATKASLTGDDIDTVLGVTV